MRLDDTRINEESTIIIAVDASTPCTARCAAPPALCSENSQRSPALRRCTCTRRRASRDLTTVRLESYSGTQRGSKRLQRNRMTRTCQGHPLTPQSCAAIPVTYFAGIRLFATGHIGAIYRDEISRADTHRRRFDDLVMGWLYRMATTIQVSLLIAERLVAMMSGEVNSTNGLPGS